MSPDGPTPAGPALDAWIAGRVPPVPAGFADRMRPSGVGDPLADGVVRALADEAARALGHALEAEGRERGGAFDLLAADGFLTWAAEAALETDDPDRALAELIERFSR